MEEKLRSLEKRLEKLENKEREVYILSKYDTYIERYVIISCFSKAEKAVEEVKDILEYYSITEQELNDLEYGESAVTEDYNDPELKIEKYLLL